MSLLAHGYCLNGRFLVNPIEGMKVFIEKDKLTIEIEKIKIVVERFEYSRETDHWHSTDFLNYGILVTCGDEELMHDNYVTQFKLLEGKGKYYLNTRFTSSRSGSIRNGFGSKIKSHSFTNDGLYRKEERKCDCKKEELGMHGCEECI